MRKYTLPTGYLFSDTYSKGDLETLSIGDYGKDLNVKADFLGLSRPIDGVPNGTPCRPLQEKWVVTLSTQYGCQMKCTFCDVPNVPWRGNVTYADLWSQLGSALDCFPDVGYTERLNIHFARMGEPIFNEAVFVFAEALYRSKSSLPVRVECLHPVLTTSMPKSLGVVEVENRLQRWVEIKNNLYNGQAGLQVSINSTDDAQRNAMFGGSSLSLEIIARILDRLPLPVGRKYCLNFAYASGYIVNALQLRRLFDPRRFMVKITPIHNNNACRANGIEAVGGYASYQPYSPIEAALSSVGFDVLVFVPSIDEEDGLVTCGNAVLGGGKLRDDLAQMNIKGQP